MTYEESLAYIASLQTRGWRLGLDRMEELVRRAGLADFIGAGGTPKFIHVAGTNGKGSVTAYLQAMLCESGFRTGGFFSPFVYDIRERIQLDAEPISIEDFTRHTSRLMPIAESLTDTEFQAVTEFEFKTAMGLDYWKTKQAEWIALEVGLGGRLDATNVVTPACSVIVSIGLDHTQILGETLAEIAEEKAGILKPGVPAVVGDLPREALHVVEKKAREMDCDLWRLGRELRVEKSESNWRVITPVAAREKMSPPLPGKHQVENMAVAVAAMDASGATKDGASLEIGLRNVRLPGRFERRFIPALTPLPPSPEGRGGIGATVEVVLDGAHNAESMHSLVETLNAEFPGAKFLTVFGMVQGHDPAPVVRLVESVSDEVYAAPIDFRRSYGAAELRSLFRIKCTEFESSASAIRAAIERANGRKVLVTGSFYLVGEVGNFLNRMRAEGR